MPKRLSEDKIRVQVQTFPQFLTIVWDAFYGEPAADPSVKRQELHAQLPSERERRWSGAEINTKVSESADTLRAEYQHFDVKRFLSSVNDPSLTWVRRTTSAGNEKMVLGGDPRPIDVYYLSDMSPRNEDGCGRSLGDPACTAIAARVPPRERFENPRTLNHHTMLGAASTYKGINTNLLYIGSRGSHFSRHVEDSLLQSTSYLQKGSSKFWFFIPAPERPRAERVMQRLGVNERMAALSSGEGIPSECRLALALRMLAGASYLDCMLAFGIGRCTVYTVFYEVRSRFFPVVVTPFLSAHSRVSLSPDCPFWYSFIPRPWPTILFRQPPDLCSSVVCLKPYLSYFSLVHLHVGACCFGRCSSAAEHLKFPSTEAEFSRQSELFSRWQRNPLRGCVAAIDGLALRIQRPRVTDVPNPMAYWTRKGFFLLTCRQQSERTTYIVLVSRCSRFLSR